MVRRQLHVVIPALACVMLALSPAPAQAKRPEILNHDAVLLGERLHISIAWSSQEPVVVLTAMAGGKRATLKLDPWDDNTRDRQGYHGQAEADFEFRFALDEPVDYVIRVEDELGRRSRPARGRVVLQKAGSRNENDDGLVQRNVRTSGEQGPGMIDKVREVMERHDTPPALQELKVKMWAENRFSVSLAAIDDHGLDEVRLEVRDAAGAVVDSETFSAGGTVFKRRSKTFDLPAGRYAVTAQAVDDKGNTSNQRKKDVVLGSPDQGPPELLASAPERVALGAGFTATASVSDDKGLDRLYWRFADGLQDGDRALAGTSATTAVDLDARSLGTHRLELWATDASGASSPRTTFDVTVYNPDDTAPTVDIQAPQQAKLHSEFTVTVTAADDTDLARVVAAFDGRTREQAASGASHTFTATFQADREGALEATGQAWDAAGLASSPARAEVLVVRPDQEGPRIIDASVPDRVALDTGFSASVTAEDDLALAVIRIEFDGRTEEKTTSLARDDFSAGFQAATPGTGVVRFQAVDAAGRTSPAVERRIEVYVPDAGAPEMASLTITEQGVAGEAFRVEAEARDDKELARIEFSLAGANKSVAVTGLAATAGWRPVLNRPGPATVTAVAVDAAGLVSAPMTARTQVSPRDNAPPQVTSIKAPAAITAGVPFQVTVTAEDDVGLAAVELQDHQKTHRQAAKFAKTVKAFKLRIDKPMRLKLAATAEDGAGKRSSPKTAHVEVVPRDSAPPRVRLEGPARAPAGSRVDVTIHAIDDQGVALVDVVRPGGPTQHKPGKLNANITERFTLPAAPGRCEVKAWATDSAGKRSATEVLSIEGYTPDNSPPAIERVEAPAKVELGRKFNASALASDDVSLARIGMEFDGLMRETPCQDKRETLRTHFEARRVGVHDLRVLAEDSSGKTARKSVQIEVVEPAPTTPAVSITAPAGVQVPTSVSYAVNARDESGLSRIEYRHRTPPGAAWVERSQDVAGPAAEIRDDFIMHSLKGGVVEARALNVRGKWSGWTRKEVPATGTRARVWTDEDAYPAGRPVIVHWEKMPGYRGEHLCISRRGDPPAQCSPLYDHPLNRRKEGAHVFVMQHPGRYTARGLSAQDVVLAECDFSVTQAAAPAPAVRRSLEITGDPRRPLPSWWYKATPAQEKQVMGGCTFGFDASDPKGLTRYEIRFGDKLWKQGKLSGSTASKSGFKCCYPCKISVLVWGESSRKPMAAAVWLQRPAPRP